VCCGIERVAGGRRRRRRRRRREALASLVIHLTRLYPWEGSEDTVDRFPPHPYRHTNFQTKIKVEWCRTDLGLEGDGIAVAGYHDFSWPREVKDLSVWLQRLPGEVEDGFLFVPFIDQEHLNFHTRHCGWHVELYWDKCLISDRLWPTTSLPIYGRQDQLACIITREER